MLIFFAHYSILQCLKRVPVIPIHLPIILDEKKLFLNIVLYCQSLVWSPNVALPFQLQANFVLYKLGKTDYLLTQSGIDFLLGLMLLGSGSKARVPRHLLFPRLATLAADYRQNFPMVNNAYAANSSLLCLNQLKPYYS